MKWSELQSSDRTTAQELTSDIPMKAAVNRTANGLARYPTDDDQQFPHHPNSHKSLTNSTLMNLIYSMDTDKSPLHSPTKEPSSDIPMKAAVDRTAYGLARYPTDDDQHFPNQTHSRTFLTNPKPMNLWTPTVAIHQHQPQKFHRPWAWIPKKKLIWGGGKWSHATISLTECLLLFFVLLYVCVGLNQTRPTVVFLTDICLGVMLYYFVLWSY